VLLAAAANTQNPAVCVRYVELSNAVRKVEFKPLQIMCRVIGECDAGEIPPPRSASE
jgi:hypothetical protein